MPRPAPRLHRLPQRLDWTLVPAPLDLSIDEASEKSPLPAIIVTPSSPSDNHDYSIAFLAPPGKPSLRERIISPFTKDFSSGKGLRTTLLIAMIVFILICHVVTHRLASKRPHLELGVPASQATGDFWELFNVFSTSVPDSTKREFVVGDSANLL